MEKTNEQYFETLDILKSNQAKVVPWWKKSTKYVLPVRDQWEDGAPEDMVGISASRGIYDSYPTHCASILQNGMVAYNSGPHSPWFKLKISVEEMNNIPGTKDWLEQAEAVVYTLMHRFGWYDAAGEFELDLAGFGTATCEIEEDLKHGRILNRVRHPKESYLMLGQDGLVDTNYGEIWYTARMAYEMFGKELPDNIIKDATENPSEKYQFLHVLEPREQQDKKSRFSKDLPVASKMFSFDDQKLVQEKGHYEMPVITARWSKITGSPYGWCPTFNSLADIIRLMAVAKSDMDGRQLFNRKPLNIPEKMKGKERIIPGGFNYYKNPDMVAHAVDLGSPFPAGDVEERIRQTIALHFYTDLFLMLQGVDRDMTAREVVERKGEQVAALSNPLSRQNTEWLKPSVSRYFNIASRAKWIPEPPQTLKAAWAEHVKRTGATNKPVDVDFIGLLAQAQKRYHESQNINSGLATISAVTERVPEAFLWDNYDLDELVRGVGETSGFPQKVIREIPDRDAIRAARQKEMQEEKALQTAERTSALLPDLQKASDPGSPAEVVLDKMSATPQR